MKVPCLNTQARVNFASTNLTKNQKTDGTQCPVAVNYNNQKVSDGRELGSYFKADILSNRPSFGKKLVSELPYATADMIAKKLKKAPFVATDFDGAQAGFVGDPLQAAPHGGIKKFLKMVKNLKKSNIPFFILTSRIIEDFEATGVIGKEAKNINRIGLKGNQANLILPEDIAAKLVEKYSQKADYIVSQTPLKNGKVRVEIEPALISGLKEAKTILEEGVKKISDKFRIEDKKIMYNLHWRELDESKTPETTPAINEQIKKGQEEFARICNEKFGKEIEEGKLRLHLDESNMVYELIDSRTDIKNKGFIIEELQELYPEKSPIFLGDSVGEDRKKPAAATINGATKNVQKPEKLMPKDDEYAIKVAEEHDGVGMAVIARDEKEVNNLGETIKSRGRTETTASMAIKSYQDSVPLLNAVAKKLKPEAKGILKFFTVKYWQVLISQ